VHPKSFLKKKLWSLRMQSIYDIQGKQLFCKTKFLAYRCGLAIVIAMCCMMENNNVAANEPMQVCDLLFGFC